MSTSPKKTEKDGNLKLASSAEDPMLAKQSAYTRALEALPNRLQNPISEYVKQHVEMELAPAPITKASLWAHIILCLCTYALMVGFYELERLTTINSNEIKVSLVKGFGLFLVIWVVSLILSAVMRIQTRQFRLSAVFFASTCAVTGFILASKISPFIFFFSRPHWLATAISETLYVGVIIFWIHWYLKNALHTTRRQIVKITSLAIGVLIVFGIFANNYKGWFAEEQVPEVYVVPFVPNAGREVNLDAIVEENLTQALSNAKDFSIDHRLRGWQFQKDKKYDKAIASYDAAIKADPNNESAYLNRGDMWIEVGDLARAIKDFDQADKITKSKKRSYHGRVVVAFAKGDFEQAIKVAEEGIKQDPEASNLYKMIGIVNFYRGDFVAATAAWKKALEITPKNLPAAVWNEIVNRKTGKNSQLQRDVASAKRKKWPRPVADLFLGKIDPKALNSAAVADDGSNYSLKICEANFFGAQWEMQNGKPVAAISLFEAARVECPRRDPLWHAAGLELEKLKKKSL